MFKTLLSSFALSAALAAPASAQYLQMPTQAQTIARERAVVGAASAQAASQAYWAGWQTDAMLGRPVAPPQQAAAYANALAVDTYNMTATYNPNLPYGGQFPGAVYAIPQPQPYYLPGAGGYPVGPGGFGGGGFDNIGWGIGVNAGIGGNSGSGRNYDYNNTSWGVGVNGGVGGNSGSWGGGGFNNIGWGVGVNGGVGGNSGSFRSW